MATSWEVRAEPREWQKLALRKWRDGGRRGVVSVVTGGGKTIFAGLCVADFMKASAEGRVVVIVPTLALLDQWFVSLVEDLGVDPDNIATYSGEGRPREPSPINLLVINTARHVAPGLSQGQQTMLVVDECHRIASPVNSLGLEGDWSATLGMSATPEREYDDGFEATVAPALGEIIFSYDYDAARKDGVIAPYDLVNVAVSLTDPEQERYDAYTRRLARLLEMHKRGEDVGDRLSRLLRERAAVSARAAMRVPVAVKLADQHRRARLLIFHEQIQAAERIAALLRERGHRTATYHSRLGPELRRDNLRLFRRGQFDSLVSCRALDEGVNVPEATIAVIASSTATLRQRIQRLGRVLRPAPGKERALVYTLYATDVEERRLRQEAEESESADSVTWMTAELPTHG